MAATRSRITPEQYLEIPNPEPPWLEYYRGEVIAKPLPNIDHFLVSGALHEVLTDYRREHGGAFGGEGRTRFSGPDPAYLLPDISYYRRGTRMRDGQLLLPPTFAIEIVSPSQSDRYNRERAEFFRANGVEEVWVVNPIDRTITVFDAHHESAVLGEGMCRSSSLPGFEVDVAGLFAGLDAEYA